VLGQFLGFLARDIANHSERLQAVDFGLVQRLRSLSSGLPALTVSGQDALTTHPASPSGRNLDRGQQAKAEALRLQMHADPAGAGPHHRLGYRRCRDDRLDPHGAAGANDLVFWEPARGEMIAAVHGIPGNRSAGLPTEIDF